MKKIVLLVLLAVLGAAAFLFLQGKESPVGQAPAAAPSAPSGYLTYKESYPLSVAFQYPQGWNIYPMTGKGEPYAQLTIKGPRNKADTYRSAFIVRLNPSRSSGGRYDSLEQLKKDRLEHLFKDGKVESEGKLRVANMPAQDAVVTYTIPPLLQQGLKGLPIDVRSRMVFFERGGAFYEIQYLSDTSEFDSYRAHFEKLLKSFSFNLK